MKSSVYNLRGSLVAIVTPFTKANKVDLAAYKRLLQMHLHGGTNGIVVCGTTGEADSLNASEASQLISLTVETVGKKIPVIAGATAITTEHAIENAVRAKQAGADALLVAPPPYLKPSDSGLYQHYQAIIEATKLPMVVYNIVGRTAKNISTPLLMKLAANFKEVFAVKEASGDINQVMEVLAVRPRGFKVYSGEDHLSVLVTLMGGDGCISVVANEVPRQYAQMMQYALAGRRDQAMKLHFKYLDLMRANFLESNPIPVKAALAAMGKIEEVYRLPMVKMTSPTKSSLKQVLKKHSLIK